MKNFLIIVILLITFCGCENKKEEYKKELKTLQNNIKNAQRDYDYIIEQTTELNAKESVKQYQNNMQQYQNQISQLESEKQKLTNDINTLKNSEQYEKAIQNSKIVYMLTIQLKQSHFSLNISTHIKDDMNAVKFQFPTNKEYYDSLIEGQKILEKFRAGSFWMEGSFGDWNVTVIKKETIIIQ